MYAKQALNEEKVKEVFELLLQSDSINWLILLKEFSNESSINKNENIKSFYKS